MIPLAQPSTRVLLAAASTAVALGFYVAHRQNNVYPLIDKPEFVARRVEANEKECETEVEPEYDVVIIGGGTAGCVLASRISEDPNVRVLLLEAGGSSRHVALSQMPAGFSQLMHTSRDYDLWTEPQVNAEGVKKFWPRGKMLGGCSAMNAMMFHTGAPTDYDEWSQSEQEGADAWAHKNFLKYFLKFEKFTSDPRYPYVDPAMRGSGGPVRVGYFSHVSRATPKWLEACVNIGIPWNPDVNTPAGTMGVTKVLTYINASGRRVTTETAYLTPEVLKRPNLKVAVHSHVTRILFDITGLIKKATGVEFGRVPGGSLYRVRVNMEVVLASGAIHSPHILLLSGVGPKDHLAAHGIPLVHDLPGVGQRLQDHIVVNTRLHVKPNHSLQFLAATKGFGLIKALLALVRWRFSGKGPMSTNSAEAAAFVRSDDERLFPPDKYNIKDESSGSNAPDLEAFVVPLGFTEHGHGPVPPVSMVSMGAVLLRPQSWGTITLKSADPFEAPRIDPRYLNSPNDLASLVRGLKLLIKIARAEPFASVTQHDDDPRLDHNLYRLSDTELETEVRKRSETLYHPTSTCRMAKLEDGGVVDPFLRVYGLANVRVADASVFPRIPSGHTTAPSIAVGEKASDIIKESLSRG
ncbi:GMC oxidoreductase [Ramaria rubella]|nr:GMC oxidoreductase [Ramaria rubella]